MNQKQKKGSWKYERKIKKKGILWTKIEALNNCICIPICMVVKLKRKQIEKNWIMNG
jgi:hypothetical protein